MKLTDQEIIETRKRALETSPRTYTAWSETLSFGREMERTVLGKYWRDFKKEQPLDDGWYIVIVRMDEDVCADNAWWSNQRRGFGTMQVYDVHEHFNPYRDEIVLFKSMKEFIEETGLNPSIEEEGSLAHQGVEDGESERNVRE